MSGRPAVRPMDLPWSAWRFVRKGWFTALPVRAHQEIAALRGGLLGRFAAPSEIVLGNLESARGVFATQADAEAAARRALEFTPCARLMGILPTLRGFPDRCRWAIEGLEHLDAALRSGTGAILVTAHLGYYLLIVPALRARGYPLALVMTEHVHRAERARRARWERDGSRFRRWVYRRTRVVAEFMDRDDIVAGMDVRPILAALARGRAVFLAGDGQRSAEFGSHPLLGVPHPLPKGFMKIALSTGSPVLPVFAVEGDRRHEIRIRIEPALNLDPSAGVDVNLARYASVLDRQLRATPHLWSLLHRPGLLGGEKPWVESDMIDRYEQKWYASGE